MIYMIRNLFNIIIAVFVTLLISVVCFSCRSDKEESIIPETANQLIVKILIDDEDIWRKTRVDEPGDADGDFNENKIEKLDLLFFQGNKLKWRVSPSELVFKDTGSEAVIPIKKDKRNLFLNNQTTSYDVYVIANNTADLSQLVEETNCLSNLQKIQFEAPDFVTKGGVTAQKNFVMIGKVSKIINLSKPNLGKLQLKRAAAKIRFRLVNVNISGYIQGKKKPEVRFVHFTCKSSLIEGGTQPALNAQDWKTTELRPLSKEILSNSSINDKTTAAPFYAYVNDWSKAPEQEPYIELLLPLKKEGDDKENTYRYRVPLMFSELNPSPKKLMRNTLYDIAVSVNILGSIDEPPLEIKGEYAITPWKGNEVSGNISKEHFLFISEQNVTMPNIDNYELRFNSSIPDVKLVSGSLKATYTYVSVKTGKEETKPVSWDQEATVTIDGGVYEGKIKIKSKIPENYLPKDIVFRVTNSEITQTVKIKQLSPTYFTAQKTTGTSQNHTHMNPYMYVLNSSVPKGDIIWGFPPINDKGYTKESEDVNNMVSPRFIMASEWGATYPRKRKEAQEHCKNYWEKTILNGKEVTYDDWRLPTEAELMLVDKIQQIVRKDLGGRIMSGKYYWTSYKEKAHRMLYENAGGGSTEYKAHIRCIRDVKE